MIGDLLAPLLLFAVSVVGLAWMIPAGIRMRRDEMEYRKKRDVDLAGLDAAIRSLDPERK